MPFALCRGCGKTHSPTQLADGFCSACQQTFSDELFSLYAWMREQASEVFERHSSDYAKLVVPVYRQTFRRSELLREQMAFPESLQNRADCARETLGILECLCARAAFKQQLNDDSFDVFDGMHIPPLYDFIKNDEAFS